jgi:hypothetical protein
LDLSVRPQAVERRLTGSPNCFQKAPVSRFSPRVSVGSESVVTWLSRIAVTAEVSTPTMA